MHLLNLLRKRENLRFMIKKCAWRKAKTTDNAWRITHHRVWWGHRVVIGSGQVIGSSSDLVWSSGHHRVWSDPITDGDPMTWPDPTMRDARSVISCFGLFPNAYFSIMLSFSFFSSQFPGYHEPANRAISYCLFLPASSKIILVIDKYDPLSIQGCLEIMTTITAHSVKIKKVG